MALSRLKRAWTRKPNKFLSLNLRDPLSKGLAFSVYPDLRSVDLVNGGVGVNSGVVNTYDTSGKHLLLDDLGDYQYYENRLAQYITDEFTIIFDGAIDSMGSFGALVAIPYGDDGVWDSPFFSLVFNRQTTLTNAAIRYSIAGDLKTRLSGGGFLIIDGSQHQYAVTRKGTVIKFYRDGVQYGVTSSLTAGDIDFGDNAPIHLGTRNHLTNDENTTGTVKAAHIFNRALEARELLSLQKNPYQLLKPQEEYLFIPDAAATVTALSAFGVPSIIDSIGQGVIGLVSEDGQGVTGLIAASFGVSCIIDSAGQGVTGEIDETGQGVTGLI